MDQMNNFGSQCFLPISIIVQYTTTVTVTATASTDTATFLPNPVQSGKTLPVQTCTSKDTHITISIHLHSISRYALAFVPSLDKMGDDSFTHFPIVIFVVIPIYPRGGHISYPMLLGDDRVEQCGEPAIFIAKCITFARNCNYYNAFICTIISTFRNTNQQRSRRCLQ